MERTHPLVVLIEDNVDICRLVTDELREDGFHVRVVDSDFLDLDATIFMHVDVIVADYMLPGIRGCELLRAGERVSPDAYLLIWTAAPSLVRADPCCDGIDVVIKPELVLERIREVACVLRR